MGCPPLRCWSRWLRKLLLVWRVLKLRRLVWASWLLRVRVLGWCRLLVLVVWARWVSRVLLVWQARVVPVLPVSVVCRPRWPPVPVAQVLAVALVVLVVWLARSVQVLVPGLGVDPVRRVRVVVCRVMHTPVWLRVLLLVVRWVLARALPVPGLVWALVVVLQASARVCQVPRARYRGQQPVDLLPV